MIGKILIPLPVDSAKTGGEAISMAADIAKANGSGIVLLHVIETTPGYVSTYLPADFHKKAIETSHSDLKATAENYGLGDTCEIFVREGNPAAEILDFANESGIDLIVMQSHDPGLADYLLGSVAARVVRHAHCSVLVVRHAKT